MKLLNKFFMVLLYLVFYSPIFCSFAQDTLRVLTHNVLAFSGHPKELHYTDTAIVEKAIEFYASLQPDILIIQESPAEETIEYMAKKLNFQYAFFQSAYKGDKTFPYGFPGAILTRYSIQDNFDLNKNRNTIADSIFQRFLGSVVIQTELGTIQVVGLHLCADWGNKFRENTRMNEITLLFNRIELCDSCITQLIVGDFNSTPTSLPYKEFIHRGYVDTHLELNEPTVPVPNSKVRIDYIFMKQNNTISFKENSLNLPYYDDLFLYLSDHRPCLTLFYKNSIR
jgi:endonuclease/exonuclease/phosphatase family metal-dependent hydrolase